MNSGENAVGYGGVDTTLDNLELNWDSYGLGFAHNLRMIRQRRGMTQAALADIAGMSRNYVINLERNENNHGASADPSLSTVYKLARALDVPPAWLLPEAHVSVHGVCALPEDRATEVEEFSAHDIELKRWKVVPA